MKPIALLLVLGIMLSCIKNPPEPAHRYYFFQLRTVSDGNDVEFFSVSPAYDYTALVVKSSGGLVLFDSNTHGIHDNGFLLFDPRVFHAESKTFSIVNVYSRTLYLDYGNGETDTLTQTSVPIKNGFIPDHPDTIYFQMNGKPAFKYAYKSNAYEFGMRNNPYDVELSKFDPIFFTLPKKAEK